MKWLRPFIWTWLSCVPMLSEAAITVRPRSPYQLNTNSTLFVAAVDASNTTLANNAFVDTNAEYRLIDLTRNSSDDDISNILVFDVQSDRSAQSLGVDQNDEVLVVVAEAQLSGASGEFSPIPIAAARFVDSVDEAIDPVFCTDSNCQGLGTLFTSNPSGYFAAKYEAGQILRIGINSKDICEAVNVLANSQATGCTGSDLSTGFPKTQTIRISVTVAEDGAALGDYDNSSADVSSTINLKYINSPAVFSCPASFENSYYPGDGRIYLDATKFSVAASAQGAPVNEVFVLGNPTASGVASGSADYSGNIIVKRVNVGGVASSLSPMVNRVSYDFCFGARDRAGIVTWHNPTVNLNACAGCTISGVESADIAGFLKDSDCFIASASFKSTSASGVTLLRRFRDRILVRSSLGKRIVQLYYEWSPPAARWLLRRPVARIPVLGLLIPFQIAAWAFLNPLIAFGAAGLGASGVGVALAIDRRRGRR